MELHDLSEFFRLSAILNLQLSARNVGTRNILSVILGRRKVPDHDREVLLEVLNYLDAAYGKARRRLGPLAVLHPLRATALLARAGGQPALIDLLSCLLHDKFEDIPMTGTDRAESAGLEERFRALLSSIDPEHEWYLMERLDWLTRRPGQTYYAYIGRLLEHARRAPALLRVKLADRLDNTLDMRIDIEDPIHGVDFFSTVFRVMFVNAYLGYRPDAEHPEQSPLNGAQRLYQLFKNAVLLSLARQKLSSFNDPVADAIFQALAIASMKEAQRTVLHIFGYHGIELGQQRELLLDVMKYAQKGGLDHVTLPKAPHDLDGLFLTRFEDAIPATRAANLDKLYRDKPLMVKSAMAFIVIFLSFLDDPQYHIAGICDGGILADP